MRRLCAGIEIRIVFLCRRVYLRSRANPEVSDMADIAYLVLGVSIIALMALYAGWASST